MPDYAIIAHPRQACARDNRTGQEFALVRKSHMASTDPYTQWARELLGRPGVNQSDLARQIGITSDFVNKIAKGKRKIQPAEISGFARYFNEAPPEIEVTESTESLVPVPVAGAAEAGAFREVEDFVEGDRVVLFSARDTQFPNAKLFAVDVHGDSMNDLKPRPILQGDRVQCVDYGDVAHQQPLRDGMVVLVERTRDGGHYREWSVKQLVVLADRIELHPRSTNPRHKPFVYLDGREADDGVQVEILGLVRRIINDLPTF